MQYPLACASQEAASVLFSAANLATQTHCFVKYLRLLGFLPRWGLKASSIRRPPIASGRALRAAYPHWPLWIAFLILTLNTWVASTAFHARDVRSTEVGDTTSGQGKPVRFAAGDYSNFYLQYIHIIM